MLPHRGATFAPSDTFGLVRNMRTEGPSPEAWHLTSRAQEFPNFCTLVNSFLLQQLTAEQRRRFRFPPLRLTMRLRTLVVAIVVSQACLRPTQQDHSEAERSGTGTVIRRPVMAPTLLALLTLG